MFHDLPIAANIAIFVASGAVIWLAGTRLAGYADGIANRTGIGRAFLGLLLLGGITSLPEIAVALTASLHGTPVLTVNDVLGSAAVNLVILAFADFVLGRGALTGVQSSSRVLLQGVLGITLMAIAIGATVATDVLVLGMGVSSWLMLFVFLVALRLIARSNAGRAWKATGTEESVSDSSAGGDEKRSLRELLLRTVAVGVSILVAGFLLTKAGDAIATQSGLGASFFAIVFLAAATSLPEISTVTAAVRMGQYELAIADVFGTNIFNVTIIVLVDALYAGGPVLLEVGKASTLGALLCVLLTTVYLAGMIERRDRTFFRMGYDSVAVLMVYAGGLALLYLVR